MNLSPLATVPDRSSVPPLAVIVPLPAFIGAATVPKPLSVAPVSIVRPELSVSVPPASRIVPLVMLSATLMVRAPPVPISKV